MKKYIYTGAVAAVLTGIVCLQQWQTGAVKKDRDTCRQNTHTLLSDIERYRTADSLQSVSTGELSLTADGYRKYRKNGVKPIEKLKAGKSRLQQAVSTQTETVYSFEGTFRDSIRHTVSGSLSRRDALKYISINEKRFDLCGRIDDSGKFTGSPESRDSLLYVEHIIPKRFRFIKRGVKERRQETVSRNPHTRIEGAEFVTVKNNFRQRQRNGRPQYFPSCSTANRPGTKFPTWRKKRRN